MKSGKWISLLVLVSALSGSVAISNAALAAVFSPPNALVVGDVRAAVTSVKNIFNNDQNVYRSESANKYNPNAAAIGQMLGGAKSLDLGGIGGAGYNDRHVAYCSIKYGSYDARNNSFLAFSGERKQCRSPYEQIN